MSIVASDILIFKSSFANSGGGVISADQIVDANLNNLFPDVTGDQAAAGLQLYAKFFIENSHPTLTFQSAILWISTPPHSNEVVSLAIGDATDSDPLNPLLVYETPTTQANAIELGDVLPGESVGVWIGKLTNAGATAFPATSVQLSIKGQTL